MLQYDTNEEMLYSRILLIKVLVTEMDLIIVENMSLDFLQSKQLYDYVVEKLLV